jgi:hypothetical protein
MHDRPFSLQALIILVALMLDVSSQIWLGFSFRAPRFTALAIAVVGLRWGSIAGGYWGAGAGLILALHSGDLPFAPTAALAAAGWLAGELPGRFVFESFRSIGLAIAAVALTEVGLVCLLRWTTPPGGIVVPVWTLGWAVILGPLLYRLVVRLSTPPPPPHLPVEPE